MHASSMVSKISHRACAASQSLCYYIWSVIADLQSRARLTLPPIARMEIIIMLDTSPSVETTSPATSKSGGRAKSLANLKPIQKGQVLNPRGRPKKDLDLAVMAQVHAQAAIDTLVSVMNDVKASPSARVSAAAELLDRGFGRAPASLDVNHEHSFRDGSTSSDGAMSGISA